MTRGARLAAAVVVAATLLTNPPPAAAQHGPPVEAVQIEPTTAPVTAAEAIAWRADLAQLAGSIPYMHPDPWHAVTEPAWTAAVDRLDAAIPTLARHEIIVRIARLVAMIGDGHTSVPLTADPAIGFRAVPLRLQIFDEGVFVTGADRGYAALVGARVDRIGGVAIDSVMQRLGTVISHEAETFVSAIAPHYLTRPQILHALEIGSSPAALDLTLTHGGATYERRVEALPIARPIGPHFLIDDQAPLTADWVDVLDDLTRRPLYLQTNRGLYWWEHVPADSLLYIQVNGIVDAPHGPSLREFFRALPAVIDERAPQVVVLDLRHNSGGNGMLNDEVVRAFIQARDTDQPDRSFTIIGRVTYSAAQQLVNEMERFTRTTFVGEPSGSTPNSFGDHNALRLSETGLTVFVSSVWHQTAPAGPFDSRPSTTPRVAAPPSYAAYVSGADPALAAIRQFRRLPSLTSVVDAALADPASGALRSAVLAHGARPLNRYASLARDLNTEGYRLLNADRTRDAIRVFQLNVELHPDYTNGWDSLGEAYEAAGDTDAAIDAYDRVMEREPQNEFTAAKLRRLKGG